MNFAFHFERCVCVFWGGGGGGLGCLNDFMF